VDVVKYSAWQAQTSASGPCHICGLALTNVPKLMYDFGSDAKILMGAVVCLRFQGLESPLLQTAVCGRFSAQPWVLWNIFGNLWYISH